jgi:hypothetical protein
LSAIEAAFGTDPEAVFRTEIRCERVASLECAVDLAAWEACADKSVTMDRYRDRVYACLDVSVDGKHVALVASCVADDGRVYLESVGGWSSVTEAAGALPALLERVRPVQLGFFPGGPAAALATELRLVAAVELKGTAKGEACMAFAALIANGQVRHAGDALLTAHLAAAVPMHTGDTWKFARPRDGRHVDAAYAAAGASWLARNAPKRTHPAYVL